MDRADGEPPLVDESSVLVVVAVPDGAILVVVDHLTLEFADAVERPLADMTAAIVEDGLVVEGKLRLTIRSPAEGVRAHGILHEQSNPAVPVVVGDRAMLRPGPHGGMPAVGGDHRSLSHDKPRDDDPLVGIGGLARQSVVFHGAIRLRYRSVEVNDHAAIASVLRPGGRGKTRGEGKERAPHRLHERSRPPWIVRATPFYPPWNRPPNRPQ